MVNQTEIEKLSISDLVLLNNYNREWLNTKEVIEDANIVKELRRVNKEITLEIGRRIKVIFPITNL